VDSITSTLEIAAPPESPAYLPALPHEASGFGRTPPARPISNNTTARYSPSFAQRVAAQEEYYPRTVVVVTRGYNGVPEFREINAQGETIGTKPVKKDVWKR